MLGRLFREAIKDKTQHKFIPNIITSAFIASLKKGGLNE
jgi:hypothetical protein